MGVTHKRQKQIGREKRTPKRAIKAPFAYKMVQKNGALLAQVIPLGTKNILRALG